MCAIVTLSLKATYLLTYLIDGGGYPLPISHSLDAERAMMVNAYLDPPQLPKAGAVPARM